ncbi:MAG: nuclear transport factor 2 family protein [Cyanobacteriota bacterium]|nr:nuclear transport factor 2 family protein [Cyanobacteriota bacterium]
MRLTSNTAIAGIRETSVLRYFETFNSGKFVATATLFSPQGRLYPPFESAIVGREAIASYLETEAREMTLSPQESLARIGDEGTCEIQVAGTAQNSAFSVNVSWNFCLDKNQQLQSVRVKLLASPQELLKMRQDSQK